MKIQISNINIGTRQRLDLGDLTDLDSMADPNIGLIQSIGIDQNNNLLWGRRRLAKAVQLGWTEIEATVRPIESTVNHNEIELYEDICRKDRTWQEEVLAHAKLFALKARQARAAGETFGIKEMEQLTGKSKSLVAQYVFNVAAPLTILPKDEALWNCPNFTSALQLLRSRVEKQATATLQTRNEEAAKALTQFTAPVGLKPSSSPVSIMDTTAATVIPSTRKPLSLQLFERVLLYNKAFAHLGPPNTDLYYSNKNKREFFTGFWFVSGGNISDVYGSYQINYLDRIQTLFPDVERVVHLFVGGLPPSDKYVRVGLSQGDNKPDIECDAHYLSSKLPFKADIIYADPPYSIEDAADHYDNAMVDRSRVLEECALCLADNGFIVWIDQALPVFKNELLTYVGAIGYIRSTGNRFRIVSIFKKATPCQNTSSSKTTDANTNSKNVAEFV